MRKITGYDIIETIDRLPKNRVYNYVSLQTKGVIKIVEVRRPGGPIRFKRWNETIIYRFFYSLQPPPSAL